MGTVNAEIKFINSDDLAFARNGTIKPEEVRTVTVTAVADTGAMYPVITEELCEKLGLAIKEEGKAHIANGQSIPCKITEPIEIRWKDRFATSNAIIIPGAKKILLGVLALEAMDLIVDPVKQELVGANGDKPEFLAL